MGRCEETMPDALISASRLERAIPSYRLWQWDRIRRERVGEKRHQKDGEREAADEIILLFPAEMWYSYRRGRDPGRTWS